MNGPPPAAPATPGGRLTLLHTGAFSGSVPALRAALDRVADVAAHDLMPLARNPRLAPDRLRALREVRRAGGGIPWTKTRAWTAALERHVHRHRLLDPGTPALIVQTLAAPSPPPGVRYGVYTDRVGLEGAAVGGAHRSRFTEGWLLRERALLLGAHRVYVMGPSTATALTTAYRLPADRIRVVGAGPNVPPPAYDADQAGAAHAADTPGTGNAADATGAAGDPDAVEQPPRLLFVGTQWELKGGPALLTAFSRLHAADPRWRLELAGSGPQETPPPGVTALGRLPHAAMDAAYRRADAIVIPTHMEAFGIALVEGLLRGLPCVATTVGNQPWIVGDAGFTVAPGDVDGLTTALRQLAADYPAFRKKALARGAELGATMTWDQVAGTIADDLL